MTFCQQINMYDSESQSTTNFWSAIFGVICHNECNWFFTLLEPFFNSLYYFWRGTEVTSKAVAFIPHWRVLTDLERYSCSQNGQITDLVNYLTAGFQKITEICSQTHCVLSFIHFILDYFQSRHLLKQIDTVFNCKNEYRFFISDNWIRDLTTFFVNKVINVQLWTIALKVT